jgi:hypothetical protein
MLETSTSARFFDRRVEMPLEKYWKVPPSGPPEKARRLLAMAGMARAVIRAQAAAMAIAPVIKH